MLASDVVDQFKEACGMADCGCQEGLTLEALLARFSPPLEREVIQLVLEENKGENQMVLQTLEELCTAAECSLLIDGVVQDNPATIQLSQIATSVDARCLEFLESMFCDFEASTIEKVLREVNNNVENAVQELLSLSSLAEEGLVTLFRCICVCHFDDKELTYQSSPLPPNLYRNSERLKNKTS